MGKVIMIVVDALRFDTAVRSMGYVEHLVEIKQAARYKMIGELPTFSRPMYETLHTGVRVSDHGITHNGQVQRSVMPNIFSIAKDHGKSTGAAAYFWYSELYNRVPYDRIMDREVDNPDLNIQHGRFYYEDSYPDAELFAAGGMLVNRFEPDYLLLHPMGMDYTGEHYGANSSEYRNKAIGLDVILAVLIPMWINKSYNILITSDHGITDDRSHGGTEPGVRELPLYIILPDKRGGGASQEIVSHLNIAPTVCSLLEVPIANTMKFPSLVSPLFSDNNQSKMKL
jgi:predicted AlkP superfamily pyrophosphatase or phosphodiesterase